MVRYSKVLHTEACTMPRWLFIIFTLLILVTLVITAQAQGQITLASVDVSLLPEYDQPTMLVFLEMQLSPDVSLPAQVMINIPGNVEKPYVVAVGPTLQTVSDQGIDYTYEKSGEWLEVTITADTPAIRIEYYDSQLIRSGDQRSYTYNWSGDYATDSFTVYFQEPVGAKNFQSNPDLGAAILTAQGLSYHEAQFGNLSAGQNITINFQYEKDNDILTISGQPVQPSEPLGNQTQAGSLESILPWLAGGLGLLLVIGGIIYFQRTGQGTRRPTRRRHTSRRKREGGDSSNVYCHECGKRAQENDRFCRTCGTRLRT